MRNLSTEQKVFLFSMLEVVMLMVCQSVEPSRDGDMFQLREEFGQNEE